MGKASSLFYSEREHTLHKRLTPSQEQRDFLQEQWNNVADHLKQKLNEKYGYTISTWLQGSYKYGTLIKPVRKGEEYDVDVGVYFSWNPDGNVEPAPEQLREWVQRELLEYAKAHPEINSVSAPPKARCSRAIYNKLFHIDLPVYHLAPASDKRRLALSSGGWEPSDPKRFYKWFRDAISGDKRDQLRRLIRYLKGWAALAFISAQESRPSSILLTVLATEAYLDYFGWHILPTEDDDALGIVIRKIHDRLLMNSKVFNPAEKQKEDLNRIAPEYWGGFLSRLQALRDCTDVASDAQDEATAALAWSEAFSFLMPLPTVSEVEISVGDNRRSLMQVPDIDIRVYQRNPKELTGQHRNEVPNVAKGCDLVFSIANPHLIPEFATIEWTVRNNGTEADEIGDLGHRRMGMRMLSADEFTKYAGLHYMDCIIRVGGSVYSVRRIPVNVKDIKYPARNPSLPLYKKIRSVRGRR